MAKRILYIEDNPNNMRLVRKILESAGYEFLEAVDGLSGVEVALQEEPDLILMDIHLPGIDGLEATARLRAVTEKRVSRVPIIAVTAHTDKGDRERFLAKGCDAYHPKPVSTRDLLKLVETYLARTLEPAG
jgi:CheY-like chemotaxis protein